MINRRAELGARTVVLREQLRDLEKLARKTPPRWLLAERARVIEAGKRLPKVRAELADVEREYADLRARGF